MVKTSKSAPEGRPYTRSETAFNADLREVMRAGGLTVLHIREADEVGVWDLLIAWEVWDGSHKLMSHQHMWMELKVLDEPLRPSQVTFARNHGTECKVVVRLQAGSSFKIMHDDDKREIAWGADFRLFPWAAFCGRQTDLFYNGKVR